ncbi:MAG: hypothetical protein KIT37_01870 [Steroidobacteraceae bacterium]|nr:hypothetical protein [Steroidobacteraceae bacterium]
MHEAPLAKLPQTDDLDEVTVPATTPARPALRIVPAPARAARPLRRRRMFRLVFSDQSYRPFRVR